MFFPFCRCRLVFSFTRAAARKNKATRAKGQNGGRRRVAGREGKRGECQTRLGLVWRETGAVRNARPSRGQAAAHPEEDAVEGECVAFLLEANDDLHCGRSCSSPIPVARPDGLLCMSTAWPVWG